MAGEVIALSLLKAEKPTLKILIPNSVEDYNNYPTAKGIEEATGYTAVYNMLPADSANDKLNLIMASQEPYDTIQAGTPDLIMSYAREGAVVELSQFFTVAPNLAAALNDVERAAYTLDGGIYGIGMQTLYFKDDEGNMVGEIRSLPFYRQDWAEVLGLAMPTTIDEFTAMLRAFKDYDNGTGIATIPMTADTNMQIDGILGAFSVPNAWQEIDSQLVNRVVDPRFKDCIAYMKSLFDEGLLDNEFPAKKSANKMERYASGAAGVALFGYWDTPTLYDTMAKLQPDHHTHVLAPSPARTAMWVIGTSVGGFDRNAFIPAITANLDDVINYINLKLDIETQKMITIGHEGVRGLLHEGRQVLAHPAHVLREPWREQFLHRPVLRAVPHLVALPRPQGRAPIRQLGIHELRPRLQGRERDQLRGHGPHVRVCGAEPAIP
jgi:putative aldouronate transport system substrate-binding protein